MKCRNDVLLEKIGINKLDKNVEVTLEALTNLPDCKKIKADKYMSLTNSNPEGEEATATFNRYAVPTNVFECERTGCINSGTLYPSVPSDVVYRVAQDAVEFAAGVLTFYASASGEVKVAISSDVDFKNAKVFTKAVTVDGDFAPVVIELADANAEVVGNGWIPSSAGAFLKISTDEDMGISSIAIYDSIEDFETSSVIKIGCLTELSTDFDISEAEATCWSSGYDTSDISIERTITGNKVTPNYWKLNPLIGKGSATDGFVMNTVEKVVEENGDYDFGIVTIADKAQGECGWISAAMADSCDVTDSQLIRLTIPTEVDVDEKHYFVKENEDGSTTFYFNNSLVGKTVMISYPQAVEIEQQIGSVDNVGETRVRYTETVTYTDGTREVFVFPNVLVTSFPFTINEDETEFSFTISIQPDSKGHLFYKNRIIG